LLIFFKLLEDAQNRLNRNHEKLKTHNYLTYQSNSKHPSIV